MPSSGIPCPFCTNDRPDLQERIRPGVMLCTVCAREFPIQDPVIRGGKPWP